MIYSFILYYVITFIIISHIKMSRRLQKVDDKCFKAVSELENGKSYVIAASVLRDAW